MVVEYRCVCSVVVYLEAESRGEAEREAKDYMRSMCYDLDPESYDEEMKTLKCTCTRGDSS